MHFLSAGILALQGKLFVDCTLSGEANFSVMVQQRTRMNLTSANTLLFAQAFVSQHFSQTVTSNSAHFFNKNTCCRKMTAKNYLRVSQDRLSWTISVSVAANVTCSSQKTSKTVNSRSFVQLEIFFSFPNLRIGERAEDFTYAPCTCFHPETILTSSTRTLK